MKSPAPIDNCSDCKEILYRQKETVCTYKGIMRPLLNHGAEIPAWCELEDYHICQANYKGVKMIKEKTAEEVWGNLTHDQQMASVAVVFKAIRGQMEKGGTYRYLIHDRLKLFPDAYSPLFSEGLFISSFIYRAHRAIGSIFDQLRKGGSDERQEIQGNQANRKA